MTSTETDPIPSAAKPRHRQVLTIVRAIDLTHQARTLEWGILGSDEEESDLVARIEEDPGKQLVEITQTESIDGVVLAARSLHRWLQIISSNQG